MRTLAVLALLALCAAPCAAQTVVMGDSVDRPVLAPQGLSVCAGGLFVADMTAGKVRGLNLANGVWRPTVASGLNLPAGLACLDGVLYVTEAAESASRVDRINPDGSVVPVAQMAISAAPRGIAQIGSGLIFAAWGNNGSNANSIWAVNGSAPYRIAGNGLWASTGDGSDPLLASFRSPYGVAPLNGAIAVSEQTGHKIRQFSIAGSASTVAGDGYQGFAGDGGPAAQSRLNAPQFLASDGQDLYIADTGNSRVRRIRNGIISTVVNLTGLGPPTGITVNGGTLYVSVPSRQAVYAYPLTDATPQPTVTLPPANTPVPTWTAIPSPTNVPTSSPRPTASPTIGMCSTWQQLGQQIGCAP